MPNNFIAGNIKKRSTYIKTIVPKDLWGPDKASQREAFMIKCIKDRSSYKKT